VTENTILSHLQSNAHSLVPSMYDVSARRLSTVRIPPTSPIHPPCPNLVHVERLTKSAWDGATKTKAVTRVAQPSEPAAPLNTQPLHWQRAQSTGAAGCWDRLQNPELDMYDMDTAWRARSPPFLPLSWIDRPPLAEVEKSSEFRVTTLHT